MGAFIVAKKSFVSDKEKLDQLFRNRGFDCPVYSETGDYYILKYPKILNKENVFYQLGEDLIFITGTLSYKGLNPMSSAKELLNDFLMDRVNYNEIIGHYFIIIKRQDQLHFLPDPMSHLSVYYDTSHSIITSSFFALTELLPRLTIDYLAVCENIITKYILGDNTIFNEIKRVTINNYPPMENVQWVKPELHLDNSYSRLRGDEIVDEMISELNGIFNQLPNLFDGKPVALGMSGGHDSRMLLALVKKLTDQIILYTHSRDPKDPDTNIVDKIGERVKIQVRRPKVKFFWELTDNELEETMSNAMRFVDGQARPTRYWIQREKNLPWRLQLLEGAYMELDGIGGEQFRNDGPYSYQLDLDEFILYFYSLPIIHEFFKRERLKEDFVQYLREKIAHHLNINLDHKIDLLGLKKFENELYIPGGRGINMNVENQLLYFLSPFTLPRISFKAYRLVPYHRWNNNYQQVMIKKIDPDLSKIICNRGYDFYNGQRLIHKLKRLINSRTPLNYYWKKRLNNFKNTRDQVFIEFVNKSELIKCKLNYLRNLFPDLNINPLLNNREHGQILLSLGYLLDYFQHKIES